MRKNYQIKNTVNMKLEIENEFNAHFKVSKTTLESSVESIQIAANFCIDSLKKGGKIFIFGNGGSAADAQHIAAELVGRYKIERKGLAAIALTTDTSILTCITNDYSYDYVFSRQIEALASKNDIAIGISTGGTSSNVVEGLKTAKLIGCHTIGFSGRDGGSFNGICDINIIVPSEDTPRIQEMHILIGHTICHIIDLALIKKV